MASKQTTPLSSPLRFPHWQNEYEAALRETDHKILFKRVEIAEATLLNRPRGFEARIPRAGGRERNCRSSGEVACAKARRLKLSTVIQA